MSHRTPMVLPRPAPDRPATGRHRRTEQVQRGRAAAAAGRFASGVAGIAVLAALTTAAVAATPGPAAARAAAPAVFAAAAPSSQQVLAAAAPRTSDPDRYDLTGRAAPAMQLSELLAADAAPRGTARADRGATRAPVPAARWVRPNTGVLTSSFGRRWGRLHAGIDLAAAYGSPIRAAADGVVAYAGPRGGYGKLIIVRHPGGITTRYGHMSTILVRSGPVRAGQVIALEGAEGDATGPHLHFEVRVHRPAGKADRVSGADAISSGARGVDVPIDPIPFLAAHGIVIKP